MGLAMLILQGLGLLMFLVTAAILVWSFMQGDLVKHYVLRQVPPADKFALVVTKVMAQVRTRELLCFNGFGMAVCITAYAPCSTWLDRPGLTLHHTSKALADVGEAEAQSVETCRAWGTGNDACSLRTSARGQQLSNSGALPAPSYRSRCAGSPHPGAQVCGQVAAQGAGGGPLQEAFVAPRDR